MILCVSKFQNTSTSVVKTLRLGVVRKLRKHLGVLSWSAKCLLYIVNRPYLVNAYSWYKNRQRYALQIYPL